RSRTDRYCGPEGPRSSALPALSSESSRERSRRSAGLQHHGAAVLRDPRCAGIVAEALLHCDPERYVLDAWCLMPNHAHVLLALNANYDLGAIVRLWKGFSAAQINKLSDRSGRLWAPDYSTASCVMKSTFKRQSATLKTTRWRLVCVQSLKIGAL